MRHHRPALPGTDISGNGRVVAGAIGRERTVWAAHKTPETPYNKPNQLITRIADIEFTANGQRLHWLRDSLDMNALVVEVLTLYGAAQESGRLHAELGDGLPSIVGDGTQLRQVIHNLVQNALDAVAEQADGRVRIVTEAARNESGEVRAVRLVVVDNGPGFSEKVLKRAFEPYVTTKKKGTGLGLAVVKKIADEHGARIRIANLGAPIDAAGESVPGAARGAQVSLSFSKLAATVRVAANEAPVASRAH